MDYGGEVTCSIPTLFSYLNYRDLLPLIALSNRSWSLVIEVKPFNTSYIKCLSSLVRAFFFQLCFKPIK